ncbi:MAG: hypothetical protein D6806_00985 [Deltaproteobacteria bacterium]|nr:MAG: hypothetical protein D6806_00985 [Deltaproteobacteria bacterium]
MKKAFTLALSMAAAVLMLVLLSYCGSDNDGNSDTCPAKCGEGKQCCADCPCETGTCNMDTGMCETGGDCCPDAPSGEVQIDVDGNVIDFTNQQGVAAWVGAVKPLDALSGNPTPIANGTADSSGAFHLDCMNVADSAFGLVVVSDDNPPDQTGGTYYPTGTGVIGWSNPAAEAHCVDGAKVFAVPNTLVAGLEQGLQINPDQDGFVVGLVVDTNGTPVEGAVVKKATGDALDNVVYPAADFSTFDGTLTSASGVFILKGPISSITAITAEKSGMTFDSTQVATSGGFCLVAIIQEAEAAP